MLEELKEEEIVNKVGGRFKLSTLIQKRMIALNQGARPLVDLRGVDKMTIVIQEIMQDKILPRPVGQPPDERADRGGGRGDGRPYPAVRISREPRVGGRSGRGSRKPPGPPADHKRTSPDAAGRRAGRRAGLAVLACAEGTSMLDRQRLRAARAGLGPAPGPGLSRPEPGRLRPGRRAGRRRRAAQPPAGRTLRAGRRDARRRALPGVGWSSYLVLVGRSARPSCSCSAAAGSPSRRFALVGFGARAWPSRRPWSSKFGAGLQPQPAGRRRRLRSAPWPRRSWKVSSAPPGCS